MLTMIGAAAGCEAAPVVVRHPIQDSLSIDPGEAVVVARNGTPPASLAGFIERLEHRTRVASFGEMSGEPEQEFGMIVDALFLPGSQLAVLDRMAATAHVFGMEGNHLYSIGGAGEGPGEFDVPLALIQPDTAQVWVIDGARIVHRFRPSEGRWVFTDRIQPEGFGRDACVMDGAVVLHIPAQMPGAGRGEVLFEVDTTGGIRNAYAAPYRYHDRLAASRMRRGRTTCTDASVLLAFEAQNRLDAYEAATGRLLWHATFEGVESPALIEEILPDGRQTVRRDIRAEPVHHFLLGLTGGKAGIPAIVQFGRRLRVDALERVNRYTIETYVVDPATGEGAYVGDHVPDVLAVGDDLIAFVATDPYPRVEVVRLGPG